MNNQVTNSQPPALDYMLATLQEKTTQLEFISERIAQKLQKIDRYAEPPTIAEKGPQIPPQDEYDVPEFSAEMHATISRVSACIDHLDFCGRHLDKMIG